MTSRRSLTRGPLPPEVYWRRRFFVVALAGTLVFLIGSILSGSSDGRSTEPVAQQAGSVEASRTVTVPAATAQGKKVGKAKKARKAKQRGAQAPAGPTFGPSAPTTELAAPSGRCADDDVAVAAQVEHGVAGQDVTVGLRLQTRSAEACTWRLSRVSVSLKILDAGEEIWTSRQCPGALPARSVVVRRIIATVVPMTWNARESDDGCTDRAGWVLPGDYTLVASAIGGEPSTSTFDLVAPSATTVEVTPEPTKKAPQGQQSAKAKNAEKAKKSQRAQQSGSPKKDRSQNGSARATDQPTGEPRR
ncbi:hypothetical protein E8D34_01705 [Nocardioides sp. GY 10113]|uniref:hypothetical protein n=1 Tax=Nocardioides sp. GY 10113 TaxID=2569761 RepID=UPI0010A8C2BE|nr:hypothetical protein [Nocardioides sp. GY 10113]TIC89231.1 hypothetical protein E8D34_01705 [Nocardioides sp. GY 10113]